LAYEPPILACLALPGKLVNSASHHHWKPRNSSLCDTNESSHLLSPMDRHSTTRTDCHQPSRSIVTHCHARIVTLALLISRCMTIRLSLQA